MINIGKNLKKYRLNKGYKQLEIAELVGVGYASWSDWERGKTKPKISILIRISEVLGVSLDELISEDAQESEKTGYVSNTEKHTGKGTGNDTGNGENSRIVEEPTNQYTVQKNSEKKDIIIQALQETVITQKSLIEALNANIKLLKDKLGDV